MSVYKNNTEALSQYLQSMVKLEELQKMTEDLDKELEDSQRLMSEIKTIFNTIPNAQINRPPQHNPELRREHLPQCLVADAPRLLIPDMAEMVDVDIDNILANIKNYAEQLKKDISIPEPQLERSNRTIESADLEQYALNLDLLSKRLANIKLNQNNEVHNRNAEFETKLTQLCEDVNNFTQMVQMKTKLSETNKNFRQGQLDNSTALLYDNLINKMLQSLNEATYLLKNRN